MNQTNFDFHVLVVNQVSIQTTPTIGQNSRADAAKCRAGKSYDTQGVVHCSDRYQYLTHKTLT